MKQLRRTLMIEKICEYFLDLNKILSKKSSFTIKIKNFKIK